MSIARRHPVAAFLLLTFGLGVPLMFLPMWAARGVIPGGSLPAMVGLDTEKAAALLMVLLALFPAALIAAALEGGRPAVRVLLRRGFQPWSDWRWWATILVALPVTTVGLALIMGDTFVPPTLGRLGAEVGGFFFGFLLVNLWEEIAWAGFLQTRLERRYHLYLAALLTAIPFAGIHMPLQVINGVTSLKDLAAGFALLCVLAFVVRSLFGLIMRGTANSVLAVGLMHITFNRSNNSDGIAAKLLEGGNRQTAALVATLLITVALGVLLRRRTARAERHRLDRLSAEPAVA